MSLLDEVDRHLQEAIKTSDHFRRDTLRLLKSALHDAKIALGHDLDSNESITVVSKEIKKRKEAAGAFRLAGRTEAAEKEALEGQLLSTYLPVQLAEDEVKAKVIKYLIEHPQESQIGQIIAGLSNDVRGRTDMSKLAMIIKNQLAIRSESG